MRSGGNKIKLAEKRFIRFLPARARRKYSSLLASSQRSKLSKLKTWEMDITITTFIVNNIPRKSTSLRGTEEMKGIWFG